MKALTAFVAGVLFAIGLAVSGMTNPDKVLGFLDVFGDWDPSLAFVMAGAVGVHFVAYRLIVRRPSPLLVPSFAIPKATKVDGRLLSGAAIFGAGWGLGGFCPGPGLVSAGGGVRAALLFSGAMLIGMAVEGALSRARQKNDSGLPGSMAEQEKAG